MTDDVSVKFAADIGTLNTGFGEAQAALQKFGSAAGKSLENAGAAMDELGERHTRILVNVMTELGRSVADGGLSFKTFEGAALHLSLMLGESGGVAAAAKVAGSALLGLITNPVTLATVGFLGATEAASFFYRQLTGDDSDKAKEQLKAADELIKEVAKDWTGAAEAAAQYGKATEASLVFSLDTQIGQLSATLDAQLGKIRDSFTMQLGGLLGALTGEAKADFGEFQNLVTAFASQATPDVAAFREEVEKLANTDPTNEALQQTAQVLIHLTDAADKTETALKKLRAALSVAPGSVGTTTPRNNMQWFEDFGGADELNSQLEALAKKHSAAATSAMLAELNTKLSIDNQELDSEKQKIEAEGKLNQLSVTQKFQALQDLLDKKYAIDQQDLQRELQIGNLSVQQRQQILDKLKELDAKYQADKLQLANQEQEAERQLQEKQLSEAKSIATAITSTFNSQLQSVLSGQETWSQAWAKMCGDMLLRFMEMAEQILVEWAVLEALTGLGVMTGPMPSIGTIAKGVLGFHADGAYNVPSTELAILHPGEMVLDSTSAGITRGMMQNGGGFGGASIVVNAPLSVQTLDATGMTPVLQQHAEKITAAVVEVMNRNPTLRPEF